MAEDIERNLGEQPLAAVLSELGLTAHDIVAASPTPITHKLVARAVKGRRLTAHSKLLVQTALNRLAPRAYRMDELFNYQ